MAKQQRYTLSSKKRKRSPAKPTVRFSDNITESTGNIRIQKVTTSGGKRERTSRSINNVGKSKSLGHRRVLRDKTGS